MPLTKLLAAYFNCPNCTPLHPHWEKSSGRKQTHERQRDQASGTGYTKRGFSSFFKWNSNHVWFTCLCQDSFHVRWYLHGNSTSKETFLSAWHFSGATKGKWWEKYYMPKKKAMPLNVWCPEFCLVLFFNIIVFIMEDPARSHSPFSQLRPLSSKYRVAALV